MSRTAHRAELAAALVRAGGGDKAALSRVYDLTAPKLFGVVLPIVREREGAEDVLQDVYLKIWRRAGRFSAERASPITWLCAIARNSAIDWVRKRGRGQEVGVDILPEIEDDAPDAEDMLCSKEDRDRLRRCLEGLQDDHRRSIRLAFFHGLTYSELALRVGVPLGTMKSWIRRGLASLRGCLAGG